MKKNLQVCTDGLVGNLRLWSVQELVSSVLFYNRQNIHKEAVTTNREIVANHLAYTHLYMFLVAENRTYELLQIKTDQYE